MDAQIQPEGDKIYDLYTGGYKPQIIRLALILDVFSPLKNHAATSETVAQACNSNVPGISHLLDYLSGIGVLIKEGDQYKLSLEAATFLVPGEKAYTGNLMKDFISPVLWESVLESIRSGRPNRFDQDIHFAQDAWIESYRKDRISSSLDMWSKVGITPDTSARLQLLDIACGCAIKSLVLVKKSPHITLTCLDTARVLEVASDLAERWDLSSQVKFLPEDLLTVDLGASKYDVCLLGQITHYLTKAQNLELFGRIHRALVAGVKLVLDVPMSTDQNDESSSFLSLVLWANSGGRAYKFEEYRQWLEGAGFVKIEQHSPRLLSATR